MQPFSMVASEIASQQVAVAVSAVGGQYAMSWCLQLGATVTSAPEQSARDHQQEVLPVYHMMYWCDCHLSSRAVC